MVPVPAKLSNGAASVPFSGRRVVAISGSSRGAAEFACEQLGAEPVVLLARHDLLTSPLRLRATARAAGAHTGVLFSTDWSRQELPQLLLLALWAAVAGNERYLVDERGGEARTIIRVPPSWALRIPLELAHGTALLGREASRASLAAGTQVGRSRAGAARISRAPTPSPTSVMAIWIGAPDSPVGGSVTHASGILGGLRSLGLRVGLVTAGVLPQQFDSVIDDVELARPIPPGGRMTSDVERIVSDRAIRQAGLRLSRRFPAAFVYQRHRPFLGAGLDLARQMGAPFVLEWNSSEVWVRGNWHKTVGAEQMFNSMLAAAERRVLKGADVVASVSVPAADMALSCGAERSTVTVIPNGVDVERIDRLIEGVTTRRPEGARAVVGWVGSFGPWHGAPVLIRALARLPRGVHLLMIGDGQQVAECRQLAVDLGVDDQIEWAGSVPHADAVRRLRGCDVLASPHVPIPGQRFFGSPTKIFEYMAIGRPIVASALEQIGDVLEDGRTALLVTPGDDRQLAEAIDALLGRADLGADLGEAARRAVRHSHSWELRAADLLGALARVPVSV